MIRIPKDIAVLIVEDHMAMRKIVKTVLQHVGVRQIMEASDGVEALSILTAHNKDYSSAALEVKEKHIDLVICDWRMPRMTGIELLKEIRRDNMLVRLPFLMLTSENDRDQIIEAIEYGVTDYIIKPFTPAVLETKLSVVISDLGRC